MAEFDQTRLELDSINEDYGTWQVAIRNHRIVIRRYIFQDVHPKKLTMTVYELQAKTAFIARVILRAQALYSNIKLELSSFTIAYSTSGGALQTIWFGPTQSECRDIAIVTTDMFKEAVAVVALPALKSIYLQQALRDFDIAIEYDDENALIYLWRAVEAISYAHDPPKSIDDRANYDEVAKNLNLLRQDSTENVRAWINEIGKLAHRYARHGGAEVGKVTGKQVKVARERVAEMIIRHARYVQGEHDFKIPDPDLLSGWLE